MDEKFFLKYVLGEMKIFEFKRYMEFVVGIFVYM